MYSTGGIIMYGALLLFEEEFIHVVSITFTALILTELLMVGLTVRTWHWLMVFSMLLSLSIYIVSLAFFKDYFGENANSIIYMVFFVQNVKYSLTEEKMEKPTYTNFPHFLSFSLDVFVKSPCSFTICRQKKWWFLYNKVKGFDEMIHS